ncbi:MAG: 50S ribosomal protein L17 [Syntrophales bacterium]|nr:50S ribosomal protein L17 [Syntrophales bacterium]
MRHRRAGRRLGRTSSHRKAMMRNLVTSLLEHEKIVTTDAKAKELRGVADRMITLGKRGTLHARRQALSFIRDNRVTKKVFEELSPRYSGRMGGYTRVIKVGTRDGDNALLSVIELMPAEEKKSVKREKAAK